MLNKITSIFLATCCLQSVYAADEAKEPLKELDTMQIRATGLEEYAVSSASTATKTDTPIIDTPFSIQVIPQEVMKDQAAYRLEDVIKNVSNISYLQTYVTYETLLARGFTSEPFRDGVRVKFLTVPLANAERVEVFKGPAAVQYGRVEPGGMVNVVTKQPLATAQYDLQQQIGSYDHQRTALDFTGPLNEAKTFLYRVNAEYLDEESFIDHVYMERTFVAPTFAIRAENTNISLAFEYRDQKTPSTPGIPALGDRPAPAPMDKYYGEPGLNDHYKVWAENLKMEHAFNDKWQVRAGMGMWEGDYKYQGIYSHSLDADGHTLHPNFGLQSDNDHRRTWDAFVDVEGKLELLDMQHTLLLGTDYHQDRNALDWFDPVGLPDNDLYNPVYGLLNLSNFLSQAPTSFSWAENKWNGLYFQDQIKINDNWQVLAGGRYDFAKAKNGYTNTSLADAKDAANASAVKEHQFSPKVGLVYKPIPSISVYGSYSESFGTNNGRSTSNRPFDPEEAEQYEVGVKGEFFGGQLVSSIAIFDLTKQNVLTDDPANPGFQITVGEKQSRGIEFDVSGKVTSRVSLVANFALTDTEVTKDNNAPSTEGNQLPNAPRRSGSLWLKYDFPQGLSLGGGVFAASQRQADDANSYQLPGYARVDAYAAYRFKLGVTDLSAQLNITNLFDREYFTAAGFEGAHYGAPRSAMATFRLQF